MKNIVHIKPTVNAKELIKSPLSIKNTKPSKNIYKISNTGELKFFDLIMFQYILSKETENNTKKIVKAKIPKKPAFI